MYIKSVPTFNDFLLEWSNNAEDICKMRTMNHIDSVKYFYDKLADSGLIPDEDINYDEVEHHDEDKLDQENLRNQALRFKDNKTDEDDRLIDLAIHNHVKNNKHHCEYWGDGDHMTMGIDCTKMPDKYIYEMLADWAATAEERGNKVIDWYNKCNGTRWIFSDHQKKIIEKCISFLDKNIDPRMKREYPGSYSNSDPALKNLK